MQSSAIEVAGSKYGDEPVVHGQVVVPASAVEAEVIDNVEGNRAAVKDGGAGVVNGAVRAAAADEHERVVGVVVSAVEAGAGCGKRRAVGRVDDQRVGFSLAIKRQRGGEQAL